MQISGSHWHLLLNHFPIVLSIAATCFLIAFVFFKKSFLKTGGLVLMIAAAALVLPSNKTGETAEHAIEEIPGVKHDLIETHEHQAKPAFIATLFGGVIALSVFVIKSNKYNKLLFFAALFISITASFLLIRAGSTGGKIRRPELSSVYIGKHQRPTLKQTEQHGIVV